MLTESEARDLLALAGATVEVSPVTTLPDIPPRRRWPVLAAAAAVLAVVGVGAALGLRSGDDAPVGGETVPRVDFQGRPDVLDEHQLPSVFGYGGAAAYEMLTGLGLDVTLGNWVVPCWEPDGRAVRTEPDVGTRFEPGDAVVLLVSVQESRPCPIDADHELALQLIDFANGRGAAPAFADEVWVAANGENAVIPAALAADPGTWVDGSPLGVLRQQSREVEESTGYTFNAPVLGTRGPSATGPRCGGLDLSGVPRSDPGFGISFWFPAEARSLHCTVVDVFRTNGEISAISLRTDQVPLETTAPGTVPDLIGMTADEARAALADQGLVAEVVPPPGTKLCLRELPAIVGNQSHASGTELAEGSVVTVALRWVSCEESPSGGPDPFAEGTRLASAFLEFAKGARTGLPVDTPVSLYLGNQLIRVLDDADAENRDAWDICPPAGGYAEATCPFSAIRTLRGGVDDYNVSGELPAATPCPVELAPPPTNVGGSIVGSITNGSQQSCMDYAEVIVYANDVGQIVGVNLLLGSP